MAATRCLRQVDGSNCSSHVGNSRCRALQHNRNGICRLKSAAEWEVSEGSVSDAGRRAGCSYGSWSMQLVDRMATPLTALYSWV
eukprot:1346133-Prymnesium_polylepis.1